jgi:phosphatidylglycerophosphate synthase
MKDEYPYMPFESPEMRGMRRSIQKSKRDEEFLAFYLFRPLSLYLSLIIFKYTRISANMLTCIMAFYSLALPSLLIFFNAYNDRYLFLIMFSLLYMLDVIDGEVARLRVKTSKIGYVMDALLWFSIPLCYLVVVSKICELNQYENYVFYLNVLAVTVHIYIAQLPLIVTVGGENKKTKFSIYDIIKFPATMFGFLLGGYYFVGYLPNYYSYWACYAYLIAIPLLYVVHSIVKFNELMRKLGVES